MPKEEKIEIPEIEKSQEVLRKLQEMKQKIIQETPELKENIDTHEVQNISETIEENSTIEVEKPEVIEKTEIIKEPEVEYKLDSKTNSGYTQEFEEMYLKLFGTKPVQKKEIENNTEESNVNDIDDIAKIENISVFENIEEYQKPNYKFIGIVFNTYIIIEIDKEMYIIDQHAAHERILYEKVKANYYNDENKDSQLMLLPDIITLSHKEMEIAKDNMQMFRKAGFMVEEFGENTIKLTGVPEMCLDLETKEMFMETLDEIDSISRTAKQEIEEKFIATIACKAAVKANMALNKEEVDSLMNELLELPNPFTCPHGRPTAIKMTKYDIERKFARK